MGIAAYAAILTGDRGMPLSTNPAPYRATASFPCCAPSTAILPLCTARHVATARLKTSECRTVTWLTSGMATTRLSAIALLEYYQFFR
jgi:hypothetical protein